MLVEKTLIQPVQLWSEMQTVDTSPAKDMTKLLNESVIILRNAIFTSDGKDKDVTEEIASIFLLYCRNGLNLKIKFSAKLNRADVNWAFNLSKHHMQKIYESSGYGWDDDEKMKELTEQGARFLLIYDSSNVGDYQSKLVGFVHFRFTVEGEVIDQMVGEPCLYVWDIQLDEKIQRQGVGRHLITLIELIARRERMSYVSLPIQLTAKHARSWISKVRGFKPDYNLKSLVGFNPEQEVTR